MCCPHLLGRLHNALAVCGPVQVRDWNAHADEVRAHCHSFYQDRDGHLHIHRANLDITAQPTTLLGASVHR